MDFDTRLAAALRDRGADEEFVRGALADVNNHHAEDPVDEFGEPEEYAEKIYPKRTGARRYGIILTGAVMALVFVFGVRIVHSVTDSALVDSIRPWAPLIGVLIILIAVLGEWLRYLNRK